VYNLAAASRPVSVYMYSRTDGHSSAITSVAAYLRSEDDDDDEEEDVDSRKQRCINVYLKHIPPSASRYLLHEVITAVQGWSKQSRERPLPVLARQMIREIPRGRRTRRGAAAS